MSIRLNREQHSLLTKLAKRVDKNNVIWYNCSLTPNKGDTWDCRLCKKDFIFEETLLEIDRHGAQHLEKSNLLPFI